MLVNLMQTGVATRRKTGDIFLLLPGPPMGPRWSPDGPWLGARRPGATATLIKTQFIKTSVICSEREAPQKGASLSARQVAGDLALILSDMNNRFC